jgi:Flp pilus assembly protein TadG
MRLPAVRRLLGRGAKALARDRRGATIIEFAIVAAPFIALMLATLQTSLVFFAQQALETAAEETARDLVTGKAQQSDWVLQDFQKDACSHLYSFMQCPNLMVDVQRADSLAAIDTATPTITYNQDGTIDQSKWQFNPGQPGDIVVMRMMYVLPVISGPLGFDLSNMQAGKRLLVATSVFRSEPYLS